MRNGRWKPIRRQIAKGSAKAGRAANKIAVVTGAAQGFGLEIAQDLAAQGAAVVLTDINATGAAAAAGAIARQHGEGRAIGLAINVAEGTASPRLFIRPFASSAGSICWSVTPAFSGPLASRRNPRRISISPRQLITRDISSACRRRRRSCRFSTWPNPITGRDIIQINSKSGLQGSNRNFAYAGSKFGGIGLTQSFAMELVEDGIKVNSICPGNFFDGPLWSDPNNGLFAQYLRSGKVPGAKTMADVKRAYESRVPMGRGCTTADVMKAIYYLMDQLYETGQAVPVTGGQVMLK